jgi:putative ABC transport system permease protein
MFAFLNSLWFRLRARFRRDELDAELAEELRLHEQLLREEAMRRGASAHAAQREAAFRLGNVTSVREHTRAAWSFGWLEAVLQDCRYAQRFLRRSPGFTTVAVLSLALGIGANATVFAVADRLLFSAPPHVTDADGLFKINVRRVYGGRTDRPFQELTEFPEYFALLDQAKSFDNVAIYTSPSRVRLGAGPDVPRIKESLVSTNYFDVLGVRPIRGRTLLADDDSVGQSTRAAVISHGFWQRQFGGADSAVGAHLSTSGLDFQVVGITPPGFGGLEIDAADVWVPIGAAAPQRIDPNWKTISGYSPRVVARLQRGVTAEMASAEATVIINRVVHAEVPEKSVKTARLGSVIAGRGPAEQTTAVKVSTRLIAASMLVLLAACANLANLLLVRALTRRREIALRLAIGVSRARLASQMLLESLMIALAGTAIALIVARWSGVALRNLVFPETQWATPAVNADVFAFSALCALMVTVVATLVPAIRMTRADVGTALRSGASQLTQSTGRLRQTLLAVQVALSMLMIVGAAAFSRSLRNAYEFDLGVDVDRVVIARFVLNSDSVSLITKHAMLDEAARRARLVPGVERAAVAPSVPLMGYINYSIAIPERELPPKSFASAWTVTPDLVKTVGFRLIKGRWIDATDVGPGLPAVILVSQTTASKLWPGADPIGRCVRIGQQDAACKRVVGVVGDVRQRSFREEAGFSILIGSAEPALTDFFDGQVVVRVKPGVDPFRTHSAFA